MAIPHAEPGQLVDVRPLQEALGSTRTQVLIKTDRFEMLRMVLPAGKILAEHKAPGEIIVQCLEGRFAFTTMGKTEEMTAGSLLHLAAGEPHSLMASEDSSFLLTILKNG